MACRRFRAYTRCRAGLRPAAPAPCLALALLLLAALAPDSAAAWNRGTQVMIAEQAFTIAPPDLRRQIDKHMSEFRRGSVAPFDGGRPQLERRDGAAQLDELIQRETERAIEAIRSHRPFANIVYQLGIVSHYLAEANDPLNTDERDPLEAKYSADFLSYVEGAQDRFAVVFYGDGRDLNGPDSLSPLLRQTHTRGRALYRSIAREYRRVGGPPGSRKFDDKSVAFAVGSLAVSHAVSDVSAVLRHIWIEAGGADERRLPITSASPTGER